MLQLQCLPKSCVTALLLGVCFCCLRQQVEDGISAAAEDRVLAEFYVEMMLIMLLKFWWWCWF
jgi:hypothetical protein